MRWCVALSIVVVVLVALTVKAGRRRPPSKAPAASPEVSEIEVRQPSAPPRAPEPDLPPTFREPGESSGIAHLRGRVLFPAGVNEKDGYFEVAAEGDDRTFAAQVMEGGRFQVHLPPGRYTLIASLGDWVGMAPDIFARGGGTRDVDIRLGMGATIRGKVRGGSDVFVGASPTGRDDADGHPDVENGAFSITGLIPGRLYDLTFNGVDLRRVTLTGVRAPADGLDVELLPRATIRGAIGFERGTACPIEQVRWWTTGEADENTSRDVGPRCDFEISAPDDATEVTVVAKGKGWYLETKVAIPAVGDPAPICLNPPCRTDAGEGLARLRLTLDGAPEGSSINADISPVKQLPGTFAYHSCSSSAGSCEVEDLAPGETLTINAGGTACRGDPMTVTVVAGDNFVRIPCHRQRRIEGVIRISEDQQPDAVAVRCAGGDWHPMHRTRLFDLTCDASIGAVEYRIGSTGTLRSIPIASLAGSGPAFVDIGY